MAEGARLSECDVVSLLGRAGVDMLTPTDWGLHGGLGVVIDLQDPLGDLTDRSDEGSDALGQPEVVRLQIVSGDHSLGQGVVEVWSLAVWAGGGGGGQRGGPSGVWDRLGGGDCRGGGQGLRDPPDWTDWVGSPLVPAAEGADPAGEANVPSLRDGNLAVLVRPGTATGLGVHHGHQVLDLPHTHPGRELDRAQVDGEGGDEEEEPGDRSDDHGVKVDR